jgi:hypothetical protein
MEAGGALRDEIGEKGKEEFRQLLYTALGNLDASQRYSSAGKGAGGGGFVLPPSADTDVSSSKSALIWNAQTRILLHLQQVLMEALEKIIARGVVGGRGCGGGVMRHSSLPLLARALRRMSYRKEPEQQHAQQICQHPPSQRAPQRRRITPTIVFTPAPPQTAAAEVEAEVAASSAPPVPPTEDVPVSISVGTGSVLEDGAAMVTKGAAMVTEYLVQSLVLEAQALFSSPGADGGGGGGGGDDANSSGGPGISIQMLEQQLRILAGRNFQKEAVCWICVGNARGR